MIHALPDYVTSLPNVVANTLIIYVFLIIGFRLIGRRQLGQLTVVDLVIVLIMGSAVETAMIDGNISLPAGLVCAATLLIANRLIAFYARKNKAFRRIVGGSPALVISHGHILEENLKRLGLTIDDVMEALREHGCDDVEGICYAVMEADGVFSVVERGNHIIKSDKPIKTPTHAIL